MSPEDRLASIFVVCGIGNVPEAREFLASAVGYAIQERRRAEEGIRRLADTH
jgi:hypothetical protein